MTSEEYSHDQVIAAEVATEILNRARALLMARIYEVENSDPAEAERLMKKQQEIYQLQDKIRVTDDEGVRAITELWGPLLKDERAFWEAING